MIRKRVLRTGDGSHKYSKLAETDPEFAYENNNNDSRDTEHFWGWGELASENFWKFWNLTEVFIAGDKSMTEEDLKNVEILHKVLDWRCAKSRANSSFHTPQKVATSFHWKKIFLLRWLHVRFKLVIREKIKELREI